MAERSAKRAAGATRLTPQPRLPAAEVVPAVDLSGLTRPQLQRIAADRGLATGGTDTQLRTSITASIAADLSGS